MRLSQFRFLLALKEYGSFSRVAKELYISQPSISTAVKELEEELGYAILIRSNKGVSFTKQGEVVLKHAQTILNEVEELLKTSVSGQQIWNTVRVSAQFHLSNMILATRIQLEKDYPLFSMSQEGNDDSDLVLKQLDRGEIDIAIINTGFVDEPTFQQKVSNGEYNAAELSEDGICFIVRQEHPLADRASVSLNELFQYPYLTYRDSKQRFVNQLIQESGFPVEIVHAPDNVLIRRMLILSDAWSAITQRSLTDANSFYQHQYKAVPIAELQDYRCKDYIVYKKVKLSESESLFISSLLTQKYKG